MCAATSTILAVSAIGAGAATNAIASHKQGSAAEKAAKTQSASAQQAIDLQKQQYQQARQDFNPYQQAGAASVGRLQQRAAAPPPTFTPGQSFSLGNPIGAPPQQPPMPGGMQPGQQPDMVMMTMNGQQGQVPRAMVPQLLQRGGRVLNG